MSDGQVFTIFVGDLSIFCNESHIQQAFQPFGKVLSVRIAFDEDHQKQLPYGFVEFSTAEEATEAMRCMDGTILCGRKLRVKWATNKRKDSSEMKVTNPTWNDNNTSSVHVIYLSYQCDRMITEESLRGLFSRYGTVQDVMVKKSSFSKESGIQKGYGFVHFANTPEGVQATLSAVEELFDAVVDNVNYNCSISHTYEKKLMGAAPLSSADTAARINSYMGCVDSLRRINSNNHSNSSSSGSGDSTSPNESGGASALKGMGRVSTMPFRPTQQLPQAQVQQQQQQQQQQLQPQVMQPVQHQYHQRYQEYQQQFMQQHQHQQQNQQSIQQSTIQQQPHTSHVITPEQRLLQQKYAQQPQYPPASSHSQAPMPQQQGLLPPTMVFPPHQQHHQQPQPMVVHSMTPVISAISPGLPEGSELMWTPASAGYSPAPVYYGAPGQLTPMMYNSPQQPFEPFQQQQQQPQQFGGQFGHHQQQQYQQQMAMANGHMFPRSVNAQPKHRQQL